MIPVKIWAYFYSLAVISFRRTHCLSVTFIRLKRFISAFWDQSFYCLFSRGPGLRSDNIGREIKIRIRVYFSFMFLVDQDGLADNDIKICKAYLQISFLGDGLAVLKYYYWYGGSIEFVTQVSLEYS